MKKDNQSNNIRNKNGTFAKGYLGGRRFKTGQVSPRKGIIVSVSTRKKMSESKKGKVSNMKGKKHTEATKLKIRTIKLLTTPRGENSPRWIIDRTKVSKPQDRDNDHYREWRKQIYKRDNWKCRIADANCKGHLEAHHILNWKDYPELRYEINNGITLCYAHHPRKRVDEAKLSLYFKKLVIEGN